MIRHRKRLLLAKMKGRECPFAAGVEALAGLVKSQDLTVMRRERWHAIYVQPANCRKTDLIEPESAKAVVTSRGCDLHPQPLLQWECCKGHLHWDCYSGDATMGMLQ